MDASPAFAVVFLFRIFIEFNSNLLVLRVSPDGAPQSRSVSKSAITK
jgi:hypothetical protein